MAQAVPGRSKETSDATIDDLAAHSARSAVEAAFYERFVAKGFTAFTAIDIYVEGENVSVERICGRINKAWESIYYSRHYQMFDPVISELMANNDPFLWSALASRRGRLTRPETRLLREAAKFGLLDGYAQRTSAGPGRFGAVVLAGDPVDDLDAGWLRSAATDFYEAARSLARRRAPRQKLTDALKRRQAECLQWAALGKTSYEIGVILNLSRKTVDEHIENACRALDVTGRVHAVAKAIELGLIDMPI